MKSKPGLIPRKDAPQKSPKSSAGGVDVTKEALDGDVMTRGLESALDGQVVCLEEQVHAFDGQAHLNKNTMEFNNGDAIGHETRYALDGRNDTHRMLPAKDMYNGARPNPRVKLPTPFDPPAPRPRTEEEARR